MSAIRESGRSRTALFVFCSLGRCAGVDKLRLGGQGVVYRVRSVETLTAEMQWLDHLEPCTDEREEKDDAQGDAKGAEPAEVVAQVLSALTRGRRRRQKLVLALESASGAAGTSWSCSRSASARSSRRRRR